MTSQTPTDEGLWADESVMERALLGWEQVSVSLVERPCDSETPRSSWTLRNISMMSGTGVSGDAAECIVGGGGGLVVGPEVIVSRVGRGDVRVLVPPDVGFPTLLTSSGVFPKSKNTSSLSPGGDTRKP